MTAIMQYKVIRMNSLYLFLKRVKTEWKIQFRVFQSIADWTVWLYILIPTIVFSGAIYKSWWDEVPSWSKGIPFIVYGMVALLLSWKGNLRTFLVDADRVFLLKNRKLVIGTKKWGYIYTLFVNVMVIFVFTLLISPLCMGNNQISVLEMLGFFLYFLGLKMMSTILRSLMIGKLTERWGQVFFEGFLLLLLASLSGCLWFWMRGEWVFGLLGVGLVCLSFWLSLFKINTLSITDDELIIEKQEQQKWVHFIYNLAPELEKTKVVSRKKPIIFRNSKRIFKRRTAVNGFLELFLKVMLRNSSYIKDYFRICAVSIAAMITFPPIWLKLPTFFIFSIVLKSWLTSMWWKITLSHPQFYKYREYEGYRAAQKKALQIFHIPAVSFVFIILVIMIMK